MHLESRGARLPDSGNGSAPPRVGMAVAKARIAV